MLHKEFNWLSCIRKSWLISASHLTLSFPSPLPPPHHVLLARRRVFVFFCFFLLISCFFTHLPSRFLSLLSPLFSSLWQVMETLLQEQRAGKSFAFFMPYLASLSLASCWRGSETSWGPFLWKASWELRRYSGWAASQQIEQYYCNIKPFLIRPPTLNDLLFLHLLNLNPFYICFMSAKTQTDQPDKN